MKKTALLHIAAVAALLITGACKRDASQVDDSAEMAYDVFDLNDTIGFGTDEGAWATALEYNLPDIYNKYIALYPDGKHVREARKIPVDNIVKEIQATLPSDFSPFHLEEFTGDSVSNVVVENESNYHIKLYLSGDKESGAMDLEKGKSDSIVLPNGKYHIACQVLPYLNTYMGGEVTFEGGRYVNYSNIIVEIEFE